MLISLGFLWLSLWMYSSKTNQNESLRWCCNSWVLTLFSIFLWRTDTQTEIDLVCRIAEDSGASAAVPCYHWSRGGRGSVELAHAVKEAASRESHFRFLYNLQVRLVYQQNFEWQVGCFKHDQEFLCFMPYYLVCTSEFSQSGWDGVCKTVCWFRLTLASFGGCDFKWCYERHFLGNLCSWLWLASIILLEVWTLTIPNIYPEKRLRGFSGH